MKSLVKAKKEVGIWMQDNPIPKISDTDVLIKIKKTAICGTDLHIYNWDDWAQKTVPVPLITGHEFIGEIVEVGKHVLQFKPGMRVSGEGHLTCGYCIQCTDGLRYLCPNTKGIGYHAPGAFAEYLALPQENVFPLPEYVSDNVAAILDPFGNAVHTALSFDVFSKSVFITGAGPTGIMACAVVKHAGAKNIVITDLNDYRLDLAKKMGATLTINIKHQSLEDAYTSLKLESGFDVGLEMSGSPIAFNSMIEHMTPGGKIALLGILPENTQISWDRVIFKCLDLRGIYGRKIFTTWHQMMNLIQEKLDLNPIITHKFPIDDFQKGFDVMLSGKSGKVILEWE